MLNSGKKQKNKYPNSRVVRKKNSRRKKNHSPHPHPSPCKLNGRSLNV